MSAVMRTYKHDSFLKEFRSSEELHIDRPVTCVEANLCFNEHYRECSMAIPEDGKDRQVLPEKVLFMELKSAGWAEMY